MELQEFYTPKEMSSKQRKIILDFLLLSAIMQTPSRPPVSWKLVSKHRSIQVLHWKYKIFQKVLKKNYGLSMLHCIGLNQILSNEDRPKESVRTVKIPWHGLKAGDAASLQKQSRFASKSVSGWRLTGDPYICCLEFHGGKIAFKIMS